MEEEQEVAEEQQAEGEALEEAPLRFICGIRM